jgi:uncharacterized membrane protein
MQKGLPNELNNTLRIVLGILGAVVMIAGLALAVTVIVELFSGRASENVSGSIGAFILFAAMTVGGFALVRANFSFRARIGLQEARVLALAEKMGGNLTVDVAAAHCGLGVVECKAILDRLVLESGAQLGISQDGVLVYSFPGLTEPNRTRPAPPT